jgi:hypothetical protein
MMSKVSNPKSERTKIYDEKVELAWIGEEDSPVWKLRFERCPRRD